MNFKDEVDNVFLISIRLRHRIAKPAMIMVKHFGSLSGGNYIEGYAAGSDFIVMKNIKLDLSGGWRNISSGRTNFINFGITYRFHNIEKEK